MAETLDTPWQAFLRPGHRADGADLPAQRRHLKFLDTQLQQRLAQNRTHMVLQAVALSVVFVLIFYLYAGFYASTRTTLKRLGAMMDKVAAGDMTVNFSAHSRDELGELGEVFNGTVKKDPRPDRAGRPNRQPRSSARPGRWKTSRRKATRRWPGSAPRSSKSRRR
jgi:methyl-accepting chemotaxis protein